MFRGVDLFDDAAIRDLPWPLERSLTRTLHDSRQIPDTSQRTLPAQWHFVNSEYTPFFWTAGCTSGYFTLPTWLYTDWYATSCNYKDRSIICLRWTG